MAYAQTEYGVAPIWEATGDGDFTPTGTCIGFYVEAAGDVSFTSGPNSLTVACASNQFVTAQVSAFSASGTTATGIYALYV